MTNADVLENPIRFKKKITSQWGEDGIIEEILRRIGTRFELCVEFGAWDGEYLSNTWHLWHDIGWSSILIEGDTDRARSLVAQTAAHPSVKVINKYVATHGADTVDGILAAANVKDGLDLMSIDIDGDDYYVLESCNRYLPRVLIIEYNPTIPCGLDVVQAQGEYFGASARAIARLAFSKGYGLVCLTESNCIFVLRSEFEKLGFPEPALEDMFVSDHLTYVITAQDGTAFLSRTPTYMTFGQEAVTHTKLKQWLLPRKRHPRLISSSKLVPVNIDKV